MPVRAGSYHVLRRSMTWPVTPCPRNPVVMIRPKREDAGRPFCPSCHKNLEMPMPLAECKPVSRQECTLEHETMNAAEMRPE